MPRTKYGSLLEELEKASAFSLKSLERRLGKSYAKTFVHNLRKKGKIITLIKGWYTFRKSPEIITIPLGEAYIGLGSAASIHGAWNQASNLDVLTTAAPRKVSVGERIIAGRKVIIRRIDKIMYFGYESIRLNETDDWIKISDPEKTLIDMIYYNYPFFEDIFPGLIKIIDRGKLSSYIKKMENIRGAKKIKMEIKKILGNKLA